MRAVSSGTHPQTRSANSASLRLSGPLGGPSRSIRQKPASGTCDRVSRLEQALIELAGLAYVRDGLADPRCRHFQDEADRLMGESRCLLSIAIPNLRHSDRMPIAVVTISSSTPGAFPEDLADMIEDYLDALSICLASRRAA